MAQRICAADWCDTVLHQVHRYCESCRFWVKVEVTGCCWYWTGDKWKSGYGRFTFRGASRRAHRVAHTLLVGDIPDGMTTDHLCRNRLCVNPDHWELVTAGVNSQRSFGPQWLNRVKTQCPQGHLYDEANTRVIGGRRYCKMCVNERSLAYYYKRKANGGRPLRAPSVQDQQL